MSLVCFLDGVPIDTSGEYRTLELDNDWYVVGHETLQPCANHLEAITVRDELQRAVTSATHSTASTTSD